MFYLIADYVGHMKLVNEQTLSDSLVLDEVEIASSRRILVHVQTHEWILYSVYDIYVYTCFAYHMSLVLCSGPVMKLYLWDKAAAAFCEKFKALEKPPTVILVTTVNPKRFGG